jgi:hypothetical protein
MSLNRSLTRLAAQIGIEAQRPEWQAWLSSARGSSPVNAPKPPGPLRSAGISPDTPFCNLLRYVIRKGWQPLWDEMPEGTNGATTCHVGNNDQGWQLGLPTTISINSELSSLAALQTLSHEILHALACDGNALCSRLGHDQKEAAAFAACDAMGLADLSFSAGFVLQHGQDRVLERIEVPDVANAAKLVLGVLRGSPAS